MSNAFGKLVLGGLIGVAEMGALAQLLEYLLTDAKTNTNLFFLVVVPIGSVVGTTITAAVVAIRARENGWLPTFMATIFTMLIGAPVCLIGAITLTAFTFTFGWFGVIIYLAHFVIVYILAATVSKAHRRQ